ncbi:MAG: hypothetical protein AAGA54_27795 [Myxococcota bacterium]
MTSQASALHIALRSATLGLVALGTACSPLMWEIEASVEREAPASALVDEASTEVFTLAWTDVVAEQAQWLQVSAVVQVEGEGRFFGELALVPSDERIDPVRSAFELGVEDEDGFLSTRRAVSFQIPIEDAVDLGSMDFTVEVDGESADEGVVVTWTVFGYAGAEGDADTPAGATLELTTAD